MNHLLLLPLLLAAPAHESPRDSQSPYRLVICLRVADDPLLTERFAYSVSREVRDQLRNFFGPLADVSVKTSGHWLVDDYPNDDVDLPFLDPEIMEARELTEQAFVFRISVERSRYHVRWRQVDGHSGQIGPIQSKQTPDRQWVAKAICLAVRDDFAVRAIVTQGSTPKNIQVSFVGREHKNYLERVLGDRIFMQLYWIAKRRSGTARTAVPQTLVLWAREKARFPTESDRYTTEIVSNDATPFSRNAGVTYEAVRIHTQPGRLRLRLVDRDRGTPISNRQVSANDRGFASLTPSDILPSVIGDRVFVSPKVLQHIAYVRIEGGGSFVNVPLPITQDVCDHVLPIAADRQILAKNDYERNLRFLLQDLQTLSSIQSASVTAANDANGRKRYEEALKSVEEVVTSTSPQLRTAESSLRDLKQQVQDLKIKNTKQIDLAEGGLKQLRDRHKELSELRTTIAGAIDKRDAQGRANVLIKLGEQAERDADFEEAMTRYELALGEQPDQPALARKLDTLKEQWRIKGPAHEAARELIYDRWASAEITELEALLPEVRGALDTFRSLDDNLTARKLMNVNTAHLAALNDLVVRLAERTSDEDRQETDKYVGVTETIATFQEAVAQFVSDSISRTSSDSSESSEADTSVPEPPRNSAKGASKDGSSLLDLDSEEEEPLNNDGGKK